MTTHQETTRTPDYDPGLNSSIINLLLSGIDGGFEKGSLPCSDADDSLYSKTITLGQFPLYTSSCRIGIGIASILFGLLGIGAIVAAVLSSLSLFIAVPIAVVSILFFVFTGAIFIGLPNSQHRYVLVELNCKKCNGDHTVLYDAITKMKRRRFGYYTNKTCMTLQVSSTKRTYEFIDEAFEEMPNRLGSPVPGAYNCKDWADDLYTKIA
ncbi:hypothetical protein FO519_010017 [Halicephalobus sp. NKZ332]|nr:hypothetical protein FO519_010017 [Halicephalobus sp. NKZ332]